MSVAPSPAKSAVTRTSRSALAYGSGRSTTALTTVKIALLAPMPSASVAIAIAAKPGCLKLRSANRTSCTSASIIDLPDEESRSTQLARPRTITAFS